MSLGAFWIKRNRLNWKWILTWLAAQITLYATHSHTHTHQHVRQGKLASLPATPTTTTTATRESFIFCRCCCCCFFIIINSVFLSLSFSTTFQFAWRKIHFMLPFSPSLSLCLFSLLLSRLHLPTLMFNKFSASLLRLQRDLRAHYISLVKWESERERGR